MQNELVVLGMLNSKREMPQKLTDIHVPVSNEQWAMPAFSYFIPYQELCPSAREWDTPPCCYQGWTSLTSFLGAKTLREKCSKPNKQPGWIYSPQEQCPALEQQLFEISREKIQMMLFVLSDSGSNLVCMVKELWVSSPLRLSSCPTVKPTTHMVKKKILRKNPTQVKKNIWLCLAWKLGYFNL